MLVLFSVWFALCLGYLGPLRRVWREPVFRVPTLTLESDDWGAGPAAQAPALRRLRETLEACRDGAGRPAVMTLGVVLETADRDAMRANGSMRYESLRLDDEPMQPVLDEIHAGVGSGVFTPQLHGLAHYWEASLGKAAASSAEVRRWLDGAGPGWTEELPAPLQSRWIDVSELPSRPLPPDAVMAAVCLEVDAWQRVFGAAPAVAVPTTFIWNDIVERAYAKAGIHALITPGHRCESRNAQGEPVAGATSIANGQHGAGGILYLVRDIYFEPVLGHPPWRLCSEVAARSALGRPALVEIHRFNFCGSRAQEDAFNTLADALRLVRENLPSVRFAASAELADAVARKDPAWLETRAARRAAICARRALELPKFGRLARLTGLAWPLRAIGALA